jgi:hypothetical protein
VPLQYVKTSVNGSVEKMPKSESYDKEIKLLSAGAFLLLDFILLLIA